MRALQFGSRSRTTRGALLLAAGVLLTACVEAPVEPQRGSWHAWLESPGGELRFGLELERNDDGLTAELINGPERIAIPAVENSDGTLAGDFWSRDSWHETWTARRDPEAARGSWRSSVRGVPTATMPSASSSSWITGTGAAAFPSSAWLSR